MLLTTVHTYEAYPHSLGKRNSDLEYFPPSHLDYWQRDDYWQIQFAVSASCAGSKGPASYRHMYSERTPSMAGDLSESM